MMINGTLEDDYLEGTSEDDVIDGLTGNDNISGAEGDDILNGAEGDDYLYGEAGSDSLLGGDGNDYLYGESGNDTIDGEIGDDNISFGVGASVIDGGEGTDSISLDFAEESEDLLLTYDSIDGSTTTGGLLNGTTIANIEEISVTSGLGNDLIDVSALPNDSDFNYLQSGAGNDTVIGGSGGDNLEGEIGNDSLLGGDGNDYLYGGEGNDTIDGGNGDDDISFGAGASVIDGGEGIDGISLDFAEESEDFTLIYDDISGSTTKGSFLDGTTIQNVEEISVTSGLGNDFIDISASSNESFFNSIESGSGNDKITGGLGDDGLNGELGNDSLIGGDGNDNLSGGGGNDTLDGANGDDEITFGIGTSIIDGGEGTDSISLDFAEESEDFTLIYDDINGSTNEGGFLDSPTIRNVEDISIISGFGNDLIEISALSNESDFNYIESGSGNDEITGGSGDDDLLGGEGSDTLIGGQGNDELSGGGGEDLVIFSEPRANYQITENDRDISILNVNSEETDSLFTVETIQFADGDYNTSNGEFTDNAPPIPPDTPFPLDTSINRFQNTDIAGTYLFAGEAESEEIRNNFPNFDEEGLAFQVAVEPGDDLIPLYRFQSTTTPGTYLFAGEEERQGINENFSEEFDEEGLAFYVYDASSDNGTTFYRFQNEDRPGTYLFAGEEERQSILEDFPNFIEEGPAFNVEV
jgi:Ca2+-binding RTX toxin-like protein